MSRPRRVLTDSQVRHATAIFDGFRKQNRLVNISHTVKQVFGWNSWNNGGTPFKLIAELADKLGYSRFIRAENEENTRKLIESFFPERKHAKRVSYYFFTDVIPDWVTRCDKS